MLPAKNPRPVWQRALLFSLGYFISAWVSMLLSDPKTTYVSFWLPSGLYLAVLLLSEFRAWPWLMLAALPANFAFDLLHGTPAHVIPFFWLANTVEAGLGAWLVRRFVTPRPQLGSLAEFGGHLAFPTVLTSMLGAVIGAATLVHFKIVPEFLPAWKIWWGSTAMALLLFGSFILAWFAPVDAPRKPFNSPKKIVEALGLLLVTAGYMTWLFRCDRGIMSSSRVYAVPLLMWAGLRFGTRGATALVLLAAMTTAFCTTRLHVGLSPEQIATHSYDFLLQSLLSMQLLLALVPAIVLEERDRRTAELSEREAQVRAIFENAAIGVSLADLAGRYVQCNPAFQRLLGYSEAELLGLNFKDITHPDDMAADLDLYRALVAGDRADYQIEKRYLRRDGQSVWVRLTVSLVRPAQGAPQFAVGMVEDIGERKRAESLNDTQRQILEMIAGGEPMPATLAALVRMIEAQSAEMICSILLLDRAGVHVRHGAGPSLPEAYIKAVDGAPIGPRVGSCGTAAFRRAAVFVADIASDPLWADFKHLALPHGLRACWSTPIFDAQRQVLGTFAIYYRTPGLPDKNHLRLIDMATHTAAVCIAKHRADEALRASEESLRASIEHTPNVAVQWYDAAGRVVFWNQASEKIYGWSAAEAVGKTLDELFFTAADAVAFVASLRGIAQTGQPVGPMEFPVRRRNGETGIVLSTIFQIPAPTGEQRFVCMDVDLTERQRAEAEREAAVAREQAARTAYTLQLIAAQEAERARIAGELHDSLGQELLLIKNRAQLALAKAHVPADVREQLTGISELAAQAVAEVRQISRDLHPHQLDHLGLTRALTAMIEATAQASGFAFTHRLEAVDDLFTKDAATNLYRIVQESMNNILKHSRAATARITLERDVHEVQLHIADDGVGFAVHENRDGGKGLGLKNITERVRMLGGKLTIVSQPGTGTRVEVAIPIREKTES